MELDAREALIEEGTWLRRLAHELVSDPGCAEDVAQLAWISASRHDARSSRAGFLQRILRNRIRQEHRGESRRKERERMAFQARTAASSLEVVERLDLQRYLVDALRDLDEPYRETLVLRFLDDLPPREVARRMGVPPKTVNTRIARGLTKLRERLDRSSGGDRTKWLGAALALAPAALHGKGQLGGVLVGTKIKLVAVGLTLAAIGTAVVLQPEDAGAVRDSVAAPARAPAESVEAALGRPIEEARVPVATPTPAAESPAGTRLSEEERSVEPALAIPLAGTVRDADGMPVARARLSFLADGGGEVDLAGPAGSPASHRPEEAVMTRPDGSFLVEARKRVSGHLVAHRDDLVTLVKARVRAGEARDDHEIVMAPRGVCAGRVVDDAGLPVGGARLEVRMEGEAVRRIRLGTEQAWTALWSTRADASGVFRIEDVAWVEGLTLHASQDGFEERATELPAFQEDLVVVLERLQPGLRVLVGEVVEPNGDPVPDAHVSAGVRTTRTDALGRFSLEIGEEERSTHAWAVVPGRLPGREEIAWTDVGPAPIRLVLGAEPLTLSGRLLDADGTPLANAPVWARDGTAFGMVPFSAELSNFFVDAPVEDLIADGGRSSGLRTWTDADGRFELEHLLEREYRLSALHPQTLELAGTERVPAGSTGVEIRMSGCVTARVAGVVTALDGTPLVGYRIEPHRDLDRDGRESTKRRVETDERGRFDLGPMCAERLLLDVQGEAVSMRRTFHLDNHPRKDELEFRIPAQCRVSVVLAELTGDEVAFLDESGKELELAFELGATWLSTTRISLVGGRSGTILVRETARTAVLLDAGEEVHRVEVVLRPQEENEIRF